MSGAPVEGSGAGGEKNRKAFDFYSVLENLSVNWILGGLLFFCCWVFVVWDV